MKGSYKRGDFEWDENGLPIFVEKEDGKITIYASNRKNTSIAYTINPDPSYL